MNEMVSVIMPVYNTEKYVEVENAVCRNVYSVFVIKLESDKTVT